ncbi:MAG: hypothetical protein JNK21_15295 [Rhodospirillaceae bacterium]|nr:hypothetical protein [Rhodospirillaceae bacterium]
MNVLTSLISAAYVHISGMIVLGCLTLFHAAIAPVMFDELSGRLVWYIATDLSVIFLVFLNAAVTYVPFTTRRPWTLCHIANVLGVALGALNLAAVPEPINILVLAGYIALTVGAACRDEQSALRKLIAAMS